MDDLLANYGVGSTLIGDTAYSPLPDGLLFAGGPICASHFLIDPRVYQFAEQMYEATKPVGYLYPVSTRLVEQLRPSHMSKPLLLQERLRIDQFLHNFSQRMRLPIPLSYQQLASLPVL
ncbi:hypothetical protein [Candidatus Leptofilum sp.]|uniref:hypothetical protein n=1 Tax=Candidatus Leptofilum sp. TaxID=3241576 RepID=UPI003B58C48A